MGFAQEFENNVKYREYKFINDLILKFKCNIGCPTSMSLDLHTDLWKCICQKISCKHA